MQATRRPIEYSTGVTLVGGGRATVQDLQWARRLAPNLVCADGGADFTLASGFSPDLIVGDMDSIKSETLALHSGRSIRFIDQNYNDFDKCIASVSAPFMIGVGFTGLRMDHELSALARLAKERHRQIVLLGECDACFRAPKRFAMQLPRGTRFSMFPFSRTIAKSVGLFWPIDKLTLDPVGQASTSNKTTGDLVEIRVETGDVLVLLPKSFLPRVVELFSKRSLSMPED